jgi:hypothetical protein
VDEAQTRQGPTIEIPGVSLERDVITKRPSIQLSLLASDVAAVAQLKRVLEWIEAQASRAV